jgi:topoisomerase IA-like protein
VPVALRVLGPHPRDKKPVELHAGRYGPYVKHGDVNATVPDRDKAESITLDEAVALIDEKAAHQRGGAGGRRPSRAASTTPTAPPKGRSVAAAADRRKSARRKQRAAPGASQFPRPGPQSKRSRQAGRAVRRRK